jgi:hypothetical protein
MKILDLLRKFLNGSFERTTNSVRVVATTVAVLAPLSLSAISPKDPPSLK